jgi:CubicO group peptidase (beta-lactamase class C family)
MSTDLKIGGRVAQGYEAVRDAFAAATRGGSALTVLRDGEPVVELWEGWRDAARTQPWDANTLVNVYSVGKPVIAAAVLLLVERGLIGLDDPIARHWPSFQAPASVRQVLAHTAGLPVFPVPRPASAWAEWDLLCRDLESAAPLWEPGTAAAEHALTYGHLLGELVRRVDGRPPARFVAEEIARPFGLDFGFGLAYLPGVGTDWPRAGAARAAELEFDAPDWPVRTLGKPGSLRAMAVSNPEGALDLAVLNGDLWRWATIPAVNLHATAMSIARFYATPLATPLAAPQFEGVDRVIDRSVVWGLGVQIEPDGTWGMGGLGGNCGWADPSSRLTVGYVTRRLGDFTAVDRIDAALKSSGSAGPTPR